MHLRGLPQIKFDRFFACFCAIKVARKFNNRPLNLLKLHLLFALLNPASGLRMLQV